MQITKKIQDFGGIPSAVDNSKAFASAKEFFEKNNGGTLVVGKGLWYTGPVELCSHMTLELEDGAVISFIPEPSLYRPVKTRWEGVTSWAMHPCVFAAGADHVKVCGKGVFDGSGQKWWQRVPEKKQQKGPLEPIEKELASLNPGYEKQPGGGGGRSSQFLRPPLMQFYECTDVDVSGITLQNSPFWTFHPVFCSRLNVRDITVCNPHDAPNTDGMDIDSCTDVVIEKCRISVGDDGIAIKSGSGEDGIRINRPSRNITVTGCTVADGHGGVVIGSETAAGIDTVKVHDCRFEGTDRGIRIKTRRGRGGAIKDLYFDDIVMTRNLCPIAINMYYRCGTAGCEQNLFSLEPQPVRKDTPSISTIHITNVRAEKCRASAGFIAALPESKLTGLVIQSSTFTTDESDASDPSLSEMYAGIPDVKVKSFRIINADNPVFDKVQIKGPKEPFLFK